MGLAVFKRILAREGGGWGDIGQGRGYWPEREEGGGILARMEEGRDIGQDGGGWGILTVHSSLCSVIGRYQSIFS